MDHQSMSKKTNFALIPADDKALTEEIMSESSPKL